MLMAKYRNPLDQVTVAAPCSADWDEMRGDDRARFCGQCRLNVYNLSGMTKREAEALIAGAEGRLCVRFYRRADGTILTENCPVGLRALKRRLSRITRATLSAVLSFLAGLGLYTALEERKPAFVMGTRAQTGVMIRSDIPPGEPASGRFTQGEAVVNTPPRRGRRVPEETYTMGEMRVADLPR
jgi:hypothetical protein